MTSVDCGLWFLCFAVLVPVSIIASYTRESGWKLFEDECHLFVTKYTRNWDQARQFCGNYGADLAIILSAARQNFIRGHVGSSSYWIGLNDRVQDKKYVWLSETKRASYYDWDSGEPSDKRSENCVEIDDGRWNDKECETKLKFICQKPAGPSAVITTEGPVTTSISYSNTVSGDTLMKDTIQDGCVVFSRGEINGTFLSYFESFSATSISDCANHCVKYTDCLAFARNSSGLCILSNNTDVNVLNDSVVFIRK